MSVNRIKNREKFKKFINKYKIKAKLVSDILKVTPELIYMKKCGARKVYDEDIVTLKLKYHQYLSKKIENLEKDLKKEGILL